jgi:nuclear pore complex protein Nup155
LIYHAADYRNVPDIRHTWSNLIEQVHRKAVGEHQTSPWEAVALQVEEIGTRTRVNENVFPVNIVLQLLLHYDLEFYTHESNPRHGNGGASQELAPNSNLTWPIDVMIRVKAPFEYLVATLEALWYAQEHPFVGRNRKLLVKWAIYLVEQWAASSRREGTLFGSAENAIGLADLLRVMLGSEVLGRDIDDQSWAQRARDAAATVDEAAR